MTGKEILSKAASLNRSLPSLAKRFFQNSLAGYIMESKNLKSSLIYAKYWALLWVLIIKFGLRLLFKKGPMGLVRELMNYPWMLQLLGVTRLLRRFTRGRKWAYLESTGMVLHNIACLFVENIEQMIYHPEILLINEDVMPPEIARAMGLNVWHLETTSLMLPLVNPNAVMKYIDEVENAGVNPDACSFVKASLGMIIKGHLPKDIAIVSSNTPCDAGTVAYSYIQRDYGLPVYRINLPHYFKTDEAENLMAEDLKNMIAWLEEHTPGRMDWDRLREICQARNRMTELELDLWDMLRIRPAPLAGEAVWLSHLFCFNSAPGHKRSVRIFEQLVELARKNLAAKIPAVENEKYRAVLWGSPFPHYVDIINEVERSYGITLLMDSLSYNRHALIDTSTPDTILKSLAQIILQGPMIRHTRGPAENYLDDIFRVYKQFDLDMVWISNHLGCKSAIALLGILREKCREMDIPLCVVDYDLLDPRIVSHDNMFSQVKHFMDNVMKPRRLDTHKFQDGGSPEYLS